MSIEPSNAPRLRWRFATTDEELDVKRAAEERVAAFWRAFADRHGSLGDSLERSVADEHVAQWMAEQVSAVDAGLEWEIKVGAPAGTRQLVLTSPVPALRALVQALVAGAPTLAGWEVYGHRQPVENAEVAMQLARARFGVTGTPGWRVRVWREGPRANLTFVAPRGVPRTPESVDEVTVLAEALVGEQDFDRWVGAVEVETASAMQGALDFFSGRPRRLELDELRPAVQQVIDEVRRGLPDRPWCEALDDQPDGWIYRLTAARGDAGASDLVVAASCIRDLFPAVRTPLFSSSAFSRCGETFAYVKIDASTVPGDSRVQHRAAIEEALTKELASLGSPVAGGSGARYAYIYLALTDVRAATDVVRRVLRARSVPERSWILFPDPELEHEWVGVYPTTPPPPR